MIETIVDLPAPFGPIKPVIVPSWTSKLTPEHALTPPNRWWTARTESSAGAWPAAFCAVRADPITSRSPSPCAIWRSTSVEGSPPLRENALGPEPEEKKNQKADRNPLERIDQTGAADRR